MTFLRLPAALQNHSKGRSLLLYPGAAALPPAADRAKSSSAPSSTGPCSSWAGRRPWPRRRGCLSGSLPMCRVRRCHASWPIAPAFWTPLPGCSDMDGVILMAFILGFPANEIVVPIIIMAYLATGRHPCRAGPTSIELQGPSRHRTAGPGSPPSAPCCFSLMHWPCSTTLHDHQKRDAKLEMDGSRFPDPHSHWPASLLSRGQWRAAAGAGLTRKNRSPKYSFCRKNPWCSKAVPGVFISSLVLFPLFRRPLCPHPAFSVQGASFSKSPAKGRRQQRRSRKIQPYARQAQRPEGPDQQHREYQRSRHGNEGRRQGLFDGQHVALRGKGEPPGNIGKAEKLERRDGQGERSSGPACGINSAVICPGRQGNDGRRQTGKQCRLPQNSIFQWPAPGKTSARPSCIPRRAGANRTCRTAAAG